MLQSKTLQRLVVSSIVALSLATTATACTSTTNAGETASPSTTHSNTNKAMDSTTTKKLDDIVEAALASTEIPGIIVGIWSPEGNYTKAAGVSNTSTKAPMTTDLAMRIGSATKPFTITTVLQLVDEGKVGLDDPISKYVDGVTDGDKITVRQLAGMRSGIPDYTSTEGFITDYLADPQADFTPQRLLSYIAGQPLSFAPGTKFEYSNTNTTLLGLLVERVTEKPLSDVITERILKPLKLDHTHFPAGNDLPDPHAQGYTNQTADHSIADATDYNPSWAWAAGAMNSTLEDLSRWVPAFANGELLSKETQRERMKMQPFEEGHDDAKYGLGIFNFNGWIGHNGSLPGYKSATVYLPEQDTTLVVLVNSDIDGEKGLESELMAPITKLISPDHIYGS
jgi:D-alanyl-D-alanine carboxypeptidase